MSDFKVGDRVRSIRQPHIEATVTIVNQRCVAPSQMFIKYDFEDQFWSRLVYKKDLEKVPPKPFLMSERQVGDLVHYTLSDDPSARFTFYTDYSVGSPQARHDSRYVVLKVWRKDESDNYTKIYDRDVS